MLIKNSSAAGKLEGAVVMELPDPSREAHRIIDEARAGAAAIIEAARAEGVRLAETAREAGRAKGHAEGHAEGRAEGERAAREETLAEFRPAVEQLVAAWQDAVQRWEDERREMIERGHEDVVTLAFELGRRVVHRQCATDPGIVADQVRSALELVGAPTAVQVTIHPDDRTLVETVLGDLAGRIDRGEHVTLREDASLRRGGCRLATAGGEIDASIETQLDVIADLLVPEAREDTA